MSRELLSFRWGVKVPGYRWLKVRRLIDPDKQADLDATLHLYEQMPPGSGPDEDGTMIALAPLPGFASNDRTYYPLRDESGLFRIFSEIEDAAGCLSFANRFGSLG